MNKLNVNYMKIKLIRVWRLGAARLHHETHENIKLDFRGFIIFYKTLEMVFFLEEMDLLKIVIK